MTRWALTAFALLFVQSAIAKDFIPRLGVNIEDHSNAELNPAGSEVGDTLIAPYFGFELNEQQDRLQASIDFFIKNETYAENTYSAQSLFNIEGEIDWELLEGGMNWVIEDYAFSQRVDLTLDNRPDNVQNFNVLATGPDFLFSRDSFDAIVKLRLADVYYSKTEEDNLRFIASAGLERPINEYSRITGELSYSHVAFDQVFAVDYDISFLSANYERDMPFGILNARAGLATASYENGASESAPLFEINVANEETLGQIYSVSVSSKYSDPALDAYDPFYSNLLEISDQQALAPNEITGAGVYELDKAEVTYGLQGPRFGVNFAAFGAKRNPLLSSFETNDYGGGVGVSYQLSERLVIWGDGSVYRTEYPEEIDTDDRTEPVELRGTVVDRYAEVTSTGIALSYALRESLFFRVGMRTLDSVSNDPERQYKDEIVSFNVEYRGTQ
ncbi:MAG: hypothetical protein ACWA44_14715 [Thiotrichales bacterium]